MKRLLPLTMACLIGISILMTVDAAAASTACPCTHSKGHKINNHYYTFYEGPYCDFHQCGEFVREFCHPGHYVQCSANMCE